MSFCWLNYCRAANYLGHGTETLVSLIWKRRGPIRERLSFCTSFAPQRMCWSVLATELQGVMLFLYFDDRASRYICLNINQLDAINFIMNLFHVSMCFVHGTATYSSGVTRGRIVQFWPPDDKHIFSKHVETRNKLIINFSASILLILR